MTADFVTEAKEKPQSVEVGIRGSEYFVVGKVDEAAGVITNAKIEHRPGSFTPEAGQISAAGVSEETVWSAETPDDFWQLHLTGYDKVAGTCDSVNVKRNDNTQWQYTWTEGDGPAYESTDLVFSRAQGYMVPVFKPNESKAPIKGKRIIAVEPASKADYVGVVAPGIRFNTEKQEIEILVQNAKNHSPELTAVPTIRAVRGSVDNPDYDKIRPVMGVIQYPLEEVDLHPDLIASADPGTKLRVKNFGFEYAPEADVPNGQEAVSFKEYLAKAADGVGLAALFQLFVTKFPNSLSTHEEGMNTETANYPVDTKESYGKTISIGLIRGQNTWRVIYEQDPKGKFNREGKAIPADVARNFDPATIDAEPVQVHTLQPVNPNNSRETGTHSIEGLHPVKVYVYEQSKATVKATSVTLCDFKESGDGPAQMGLMEWMVHTYMEVFNKAEAKNLAG